MVLSAIEYVKIKTNLFTFTF